MPDDERPIPRQDLEYSRLDEARSRREAEGTPSLGDEAIAHAQSIPGHRTPGGDQEQPNAGEIARKGSQRADSAAQVGKPLPPRRTRE